MKNVKEFLPVYFIMGSQNCVHDPIWTVEEAIRGGITCFQFREKGTGAKTGAEKEELARSIQALCKRHDIPFIVNDDLDLAERLGADGVHVGQDDEPVSVVRKAFPKQWIGLSVTSEQEWMAADNTLIDYVGVGPVYATSTKEDAKKAIGPEAIARLASQRPEIPRVAIGGIQSSHIPILKKHYTDGVSVISAISRSNAPFEAARSFYYEWNNN